MDSFITNVLLITANVGSLFEDPENLFKKWLTEFGNILEKKNPEFIAVHCQEVGGKNYEESMQYVNQFIKTLLALPTLQEFDRAKIFLDEDLTAESKFTALGNLYFIHSSVKDVEIWNFRDNIYVPITGREVFSGSIENEPTKEKSKFPIDFFPDNRWSRKGFMRTRWKLNQVEFDLINIHLFHDSSNLVSAEKSPSLYSNFRYRALKWTFERFANDGLQNVPFFIFGDFNFRLDTHQMLKKLSETANVERIRNKKDEVSKLILQNHSNQLILTVGKKSFDHHDQHEQFFNNNDYWRDFDTEVSKFSESVQEFHISFPPSYPFSEEVENGMSYMKTRCPSWCDRILYSHSSKELMVLERGHPLEYGVIGRNVCMGDHKPVFLHVHFKARPGRSRPLKPVSAVFSVTDDVSPRPAAAAAPSATVCAAVDSNYPGYAVNVSSVGEAPVSVGTAHVVSLASDPHVPHPRSSSIVVNGQEQLSSPEDPDWNVFDYAIFEHEAVLEPKFRFSYKHHNYCGAQPNSSLRTNRSFPELARDVVRAESVIMAFQGSRRRRMSESSDSSDETASSSDAAVKAAPPGLASDRSPRTSTNVSSNDNDCQPSSGN